MNELTTFQIDKYKTKSISALIHLAEKYFNQFIRDRDRQGDHFYCPTCERTIEIHGNNYHACHLFPAGHYPHLRFSEDNVHGGCMQCNYYKHGAGYTFAGYVRKKIGNERFEHLEYLNALYKRNGFKWDRIELINIIETYKQKCKQQSL